MKKTIIVIFCLNLSLAGCSSLRNLKDETIPVMYGMQGKQLVFILSPCPDLYLKPNAPAMVSAWIREKDISKMVIVCDNNCNCKLVKKTHNIRIIQPSDNTIYQGGK